MLLITFLEKDSYKYEDQYSNDSFKYGFTLFQEGLTFDVPEEIKPKFLLSLVFALEDVMRWIEIFDDTNCVHDS